MLTSFSAYVYGLSLGRITALAAIAIALIGVVIGGQAVARSLRRGAIVALALAPIGLTLGVVVVVSADRGLGTGQGVGGGVGAMVVGAIGVALGALGLARSSGIGSGR